LIKLLIKPLYVVEVITRSAKDKCYELVVVMGMLLWARREEEKEDEDEEEEEKRKIRK